MTREEAKDFLFDMSNLIGTTAIEHWTEKDAEKMRQAVLIIENESVQPEIVYCKDCICSHGEVWLSGNGSADLYGYCGRTQLRVLPYDYCSYAERRANE